MRRLLVRFAAVPALVALLVAVFAVPALADPRDFTVINNTSIVISDVYVAPSNDTDWGDDIMGQDVLMQGDSVDVVFKHYDGVTCLYDVEVIGQQGQSGVLYKVDLCSTNTVTFSDSNN